MGLPSISGGFFLFPTSWLTELEDLLSFRLLACLGGVNWLFEGDGVCAFVQDEDLLINPS
jgi:hypothetical protein